jgi:hypothetical protein
MNVNELEFDFIILLNLIISFQLIMVDVNLILEYFILDELSQFEMKEFINR